MPEFDAVKAERTLRVSVIEGVSATICSNLTTPFLVAFGVVLGATNFELGILVAMLALFTLVGQIPSVLLIESRGMCRPVTGYWAFISRLAWLGIALIPVFFVKDFFVPYLLFVIISGIGAGISAPAWISWMGNLVDEKTRGRYFGRRNYIMGFAVIGTLVFSVLFLNYFSGNSILGFQILFGISILFAVLCFYLIMGMYEPKTACPVKQTGLRESFSLFLKNKNFKVFVLFLLFWNLGLGIAAPFWDAYILNYLHAEAFWIPISVLAAAIGTVFSLKFWGPIADKFGNKSVLILCTLGISMIPLLWFFFVTSPIQIFFINLYNGVCWGGFNLAVFTYQLDITPKDRRPVYIALFATITGITTVIGPILGGVIASHVAGFRFLFIDDLKLVFFISFLPRVAALFFLYKIAEPRVKEVSPKIVFMEVVSSSIATVDSSANSLVFLSSRAVSKIRGHTVRVKKTIGGILKK